jgi:hypothetical protein
MRRGIKASQVAIRAKIPKKKLSRMIISWFRTKVSIGFLLVKKQRVKKQRGPSYTLGFYPFTVNIFLLLI